MAPTALTRGLIICGLAGLAMPFPEITSDGTNVQILAPSGDITVRGNIPLELFTRSLSLSLVLLHALEKSAACAVKTARPVLACT